jgi:hypothetical protein
MSGKLVGFLRNNLIALIALFIALGGTSYAATQLPSRSVGTKQLKSGAVTAAKIKSGAVTAAKIKAGAVSTAAIASDAVTGDKVLESSLGKVPSAASADSAANATHATSADTAGDSAKWGGVSSGALGTAVVVPGIGFKPHSQLTTWTASGVAITSPVNASFIALVTLPHGASVTRMTQRYTLVAPGTQGNLQLVAVPSSSVVGMGVLSIPDQAVAAGAGSRTVTPATPVVIDNSTNSYLVMWIAPGASNASLVSVKLEYTLP